MGLNKRLIGAGAVGSGAFTPGENFKVVTYTGNGSTQSITGVGFKPDFVWIKGRDLAFNHVIYDSTRGTGKYILPNTTGAEGTIANGLTSFDSDGFTVGSESGHNYNGDGFVAWCWKANGGTTSSNTDGSVTSTVQANQDAGFSIVKYTGSGSAGTIGHGLSAKCDLVIIKTRDSVNNWIVQFPQLGDNARMLLDNTSAKSDDSTTAQAGNATVFGIGADNSVAKSSDNFIAYCFHSVDGFSKIGSYTGTGSATDRPIIETGFEPAFVMIKNASATGSWMIHDNKRNISNPRDKYLRAESSNAEGTYAEYGLDFFSNGFRVGPTTAYHWNTNGNTYIYMAFAADADTDAPTLADSFNVKTYSGNGGTQSITGFGFSPSMIWTKGRTVAYDHGLYDSVRGGGSLIYPSLSQAASTVTNGIQSFDADGVTFGANNKSNASDSTYVAWAWKADDNEPTIIPAAGPDSVDNEYPVVAYHNITYTSSGKFNGGYVFNGGGSGTAGSAIFTPQFERNTSIDFTSSGLSVSGWFYSTGSPSGNSSHVLFSMYGDCVFNVQYNSSRTIIWSGAINGSSNKSMPLNAWTHIAFTYSASGTLIFYVDGSASSSYSAGASGLAGGTRVNGIGGVADNGDHTGPTSWFYAFKGTISQVRYFNSVLTQANVNTLYGESSSDNETLDILGDGKCIAAYTLSKELSEVTIVSANANAGFSIAEATGAGRITIPHGLSSAPNMVIKKGIDTTEDWYIYHSSLGTGKYLSFNRNGGEDSATTRSDSFSSVSATSVTDDVTSATVKYIMYSFHNVAGYQNFGSYTGNNSSTKSVTGLGFQPDWIMIKRTSASGRWQIQDSVRGAHNTLFANLNNAESDENGARLATFDSDGFTVGNDTNVNENGQTYIYWAIKIN